MPRLSGGQLTLSLPAATVTWMPADVSDATALSSAVDTPPPSDMLATVGRPLERAWDKTKLRPDTMLDTDPELQGRSAIALYP